MTTYMIHNVTKIEVKEIHDLKSDTWWRSIYVTVDNNDQHEITLFANVDPTRLEIKA
jgi:hypothetical protein